MLEKLLAAEVLVIGVLDPALAQHLVGEVVGVLEDRQPRHQSCRQRWLAGAVRVDRSELLFQKAPVDRSRQLRQRMLHIDDLVEPRTKQILLAALPTLPWPHRILRSSLPAAGNHDARFEGIPNINLQEKRPSSSNCRQIQSRQFPQFLLPLNRFGIFHGRRVNSAGLTGAVSLPVSPDQQTAHCIGSSDAKGQRTTYALPQNLAVRSASARPNNDAGSVNADRISSLEVDH